MHRVWDVIVGSTMILLSLVLQSIWVGIVVSGMAYAISRKFEFDLSGTTVFCFVVAGIALLNFAAYYDYRRRKIVSNAVGNKAGQIYLLVRGMDRIVNGRELGHAVGTAELDEKACDRKALVVFITGLLLLAAAVGSFMVGMDMKGEGGTVLLGLGVILVPIGLAVLFNAALRYIGVIRT